MEAYVITTEQAIAQGSTAGEISAVANYHIRADLELRSEIFRLISNDKKKPSARTKARIDDLARQRKAKAEVIDALISVARTMRKIGKV